MLILSRRPGDAILIDGGIRIVVLASDQRTVRIGIEAPAKIGILREEIKMDRAITCIDGIEVGDLDYIDIGKPMGVSEVIPVTVKSLIFAIRSVFLRKNAMSRVSTARVRLIGPTTRGTAVANPAFEITSPGRPAEMPSSAVAKRFE